MTVARMRDYAKPRANGASMLESRLTLLEALGAELNEQIASLSGHEMAVASKIANYRRRLAEIRAGEDPNEGAKPMNEATTRDDRYRLGRSMLDAVDGTAGEAVINALKDVSPELAHHVVAWGFGEIYSRSELAPRDRQLVTLGMLTALGGCEPQLEVHINAALNVGLTPHQIVEALLHSAVYCGFPRALNATFTAKRVFAERDLLPIA